MNNKRPLAPGFINKLDNFLLLNRPDTWSARAHMVVYYAMVFMILLAGLSFIVPDDPRSESQMGVWMTLISVAALLGIVVWLIYLLRFNVFKNFGQLNPVDRLKTYLLYFVSVGIMVACVFVEPAVESIRANSAYTTKEITDDINKVNLAICQLERDSLPHKWKSDTLLVRDTVIRNDIRGYDDRGNYVVPDHSLDFLIIDTGTFRTRRIASDSLVKLNDSMYIDYECPNYVFLDSYLLGDEYYIISDPVYPYEKSRNLPQRNGILRSVDLFHIAVNKYDVVDKTVLNRLLSQITTKYSLPNNKYYDRYIGDERPDDPSITYEVRMQRRYKTSDIRESMNNILHRKNRWEGRFTESSFYVWYYVSMILSLLIFIFRHTTTKTFFLSILSAAILLILTILFFSLTHFQDYTGIATCIVYYLVFIGIAISGAFYGRIRRYASGIALNLAVFITPFLPLLVTGLYYTILHYMDRYKDYIQIDQTKYENETSHYLYAQIVGFVLLLILIETFYKKLYRKWYALPEA